MLLVLGSCGGQAAASDSAAGSAAAKTAPSASAGSAPSSARPAVSAGAAAPGSASAKPSTESGPLVVYGAGTLAVPFKDVLAAFGTEHAGLHAQPQFGGSVKMAKQITELNQPADVLAVADYSVIPQEMFGRGGKKRFASWYAGFAGNAITFVYTPRSKGAGTINAGNWYKVLAEPGVQIGRSNPDTDPSGYQTLQMLKLAEAYYKQPGLYDAILKNAPQTNIRDTETELLSALDAGQIDYLAIYRSDAQQHNLEFVQLPPQIDLSDARYAADYAKASIATKNGQIDGKPIVYAITVPDNAPHPELGKQFAALVLGKDGAALMQKNGFVSITPGLASDMQAVPPELKGLLRPWPAS
ncbi:MAG TPA: extracellular solute-binding protein [Chloroflexota bacterium]|nr:extracellular solute-binding protein [Chloroflexota bacterium]